MRTVVGEATGVMTEMLTDNPATGPDHGWNVRGIIWFLFALVALLLLTINNLTLWAALVVPGALGLALIPGLTPAAPRSLRRP